MNSNTELLSYGYSKVEEELKKEEKKLKIIKDTQEKLKSLNNLKVFIGSINSIPLKVYVEDHLNSEIEACESKIKSSNEKELNEIINKLKELKGYIPTFTEKPKKQIKSK